MKKQVQNQKRYFNQLLWKYKKYIAKLNRLSNSGKNVHRQNVLRSHIDKLTEKLSQSSIQLQRTAAIACLAGGLLVSNSAVSQVQFKIGLGDQIGRGTALPDPELVDIDNDGDLDILSGGWNGLGVNQIQFSENIGTPSDPEFTNSVLNTFGIEFATSVYSARIASADIDGDGDFDIIAGEYYGSLHYFENTGSATSPSFASGIADPFGLPSYNGSECSPVFTDIDNDGDMDLFVNNNSGVLFFENTGTSSAPVFAASQNNQFNLTTSGYSYANPSFSDMDGDGDVDLVMGGSGSTSLEFYENIGSATVPNFSTPNSGITGVIESPAIVSFPAVGDLNNDGFMDIIKGRGYQNDYKVYFHKGLSSLSYEESKALNPFSISPSAPSGNVTWGYPAFTDLDNDGDQDMLIGRIDGDFDYFQNVGTALSPIYSSPVLNPYGITKDGTMAAPTFSDVDGDGDQDIVSGHSVSLNPHLRYLENIGTASAPNFATAVSANTAFGIPNPGDRVKPRFIDLDGDGDQDMFVGVRYGNYQYYENIGTATAPSYGFQQTNPFGLFSLGTSQSDLSPTFSDVDGDGDQDLLVGLNSGENLYYENTGTATAPSFAASINNSFGIENLIVKLAVNSAWYTPVFVDIDGDGDSDIISGLKGDYYLFENVSAIGACNVNIPDANFKAYLLGESSINTNSDTEIQCSEASAFTGTINVNGMSISDLTGIEAFTSLTQLYCQNNSLSSLDISQNTQLTWVYCFGNQLTSLDVSANVNLTRLDCYTNQISTLTFGTSSTLTYINAMSNQFTTIDVSALTALEHFDFGTNSISTLDLSSNVSLDFISCLGNSLTSLNVANGTNTIINVFDASNNSNLACIEVDDASYSTTNWLNVDATTDFSEDCASIGIKENNSLSVSMFPNPTNGFVTITSDQQITSISVFSITGQLLLNVANQNNIDVSTLPTGIYQVVVVASNGNTSVQKLVKN